MTTTITFTATTYADRLENLLRVDFANEPERYADARSWSDLHEVCDANEFVLECDALFGCDHLAAEDAEWTQYSAIVEAAIAIVEARFLAAPRRS